MLSRSGSNTTDTSAPVPSPYNWRSTRDYGAYTPNPNESNYGELLLPASRSFRGNLDSRGAMEAHRSFRRRTSFGSASVPSQQRSPVQIVILDTEPPRESATPRTRQVPQEAPPRPINQWHMLLRQTTEQQSRNSNRIEQQSNALENLRKELYNPISRRLTTKVNLYYRDTPVNPKEIDREEDGKRCAICLEDFERGQEVMLTPCKHMFHEECIVPWAKSSGRCPVCRSVLGSKTRDSSLNANNNSNDTPNMAASGLSTQELASIIGALGDGFRWGYL
ncbi:43kDa postsynaptic protein [Parasponia andersonii]|uniref:43kDa postsynaptic protein n=1 Tax=Parasponia andersonii TaxID=3476 RepID=A0A2P5D7S7_PARAD|nr:43kDa postsynaptic protein [Parasponia andersonii]